MPRYRPDMDGSAASTSASPSSASSSSSPCASARAPLTASAVSVACGADEAESLHSVAQERRRVRGAEATIRPRGDVDDAVSSADACSAEVGAARLTGEVGANALTLPAVHDHRFDSHSSDHITATHSGAVGSGAVGSMRAHGGASSSPAPAVHNHYGDEYHINAEYAIGSGRGATGSVSSLSRAHTPMREEGYAEATLPPLKEEASRRERARVTADLDRLSSSRDAYFLLCELLTCVPDFITSYLCCQRLALLTVDSVQGSAFLKLALHAAPTVAELSPLFNFLSIALLFLTWWSGDSRCPRDPSRYFVLRHSIWLRFLIPFPMMLYAGIVHTFLPWLGLCLFFVVWLSERYFRTHPDTENEQVWTVVGTSCCYLLVELSLPLGYGRHVLAALWFVRMHYWARVRIVDVSMRQRSLDGVTKTLLYLLARVREG